MAKNEKMPRNTESQSSYTEPAGGRERGRDGGRARGIESEREREREKEENKRNNADNNKRNYTARRHETRQGQARTECGREKARQKKRTCVANKDNLGDDYGGTALFLLLLLLIAVMIGSSKWRASNRWFKLGLQEHIWEILALRFEISI